MTAASFLAHLQDLGIQLRIQGGKLVVNAPKGAVTPQLRDELARRKADLIGLLQAAPAGPAASLSRRGSLDGDQHLSSAQQRIWLLEQIDAAPGVYNIPVAARVSGPLDVSLLETCICRIVERHAALRTTFHAAGGRPVARIASSVAIVLSVTDLSGLAGADRGRQVEEIRQTEALQPFDLSHGPLLRGRVLRLASHEHVLLITFHHLVCDGWSLGVFLRELAHLYEAGLAGREPALDALAVQYSDYVRWFEESLPGLRLDGQLNYWRQALGGELPVLELPAEGSRPAVQAFRGGLHRAELPADLVTSLERFARDEGCTLFMALLAGFAVVLGRYSRQQDLIIGTPIAGRTQPELEGLIGLFVNTLLLRVNLSGGPTFRDLLRQARTTALDAYANQEAPFEKLVEVLPLRRDMSRSPLFQAMLILQNAPLPELRLGPASISILPDAGQISKFDLTLEVERCEGRTFASWNFNRDLLCAQMIERMARHFTTLARAAVTDPDKPVGSLPILSPAEWGHLVEDLNATTRPYETGVCLHELVERAVDRWPNVSAVVFEGRSLSYAELEDRANRLANWLRREGVGPETLVGVSLERSLDLVVGLLAILKAGGAYVPLDPSYPPSRLAYMAGDSGVKLVLTGSGSCWVDGLAGVQRVVIEQVVAQESDGRRPHSGAVPGNLAYMIYTSGSTGQPKGALNEHGGIVNRLQWMQEQYRLEPDDRVLQKTPFGFDVSVWEFFWPLMQGARLVVAKAGGHRDAKYLNDLIGREGITTLHFVPSMLEVFLEEAQARDCRSLRRVICSGEALSWDLVQRFGAKLACALENLYGPTEAAVDVTYWPCDRDTGAKVIPIGYPVANTRVHILDEHLQVVPQGVAGEIYLGGIQVGRGYWGKPGLTAEKFVPDPLDQQGGRRLYRTGDAGRYREDGSIEYLGRLDDQVKIRGFRVELGEIESRLREHAGVREAAVSVAGTTGSEKRLVGYIVGRPESPVDVASLRNHLRERLPEYMVPAAFVALDHLPLSPNGKLDRKALPASKAGLGLQSTGPRIAPRTPVQQVLAAIWSSVLAIAEIGAEDDFFELGGHSLLATQVVARIRDAFGAELPIRAIFEAPTLEGLARAVERALRGEAAIALPPIAATDRQGELPLSFGQQRLWFLEQLEPGTPVYNVPVSVCLRGPLDIDVLARAINEVVRRHEILRTVFGPGQGDGAQYILSSLHIDLPVEDLSAVTADRKDDRIRECGEQEAGQAFDLLHGPLLRLRLLRLGPVEHVLLLTMHHIICDGWSAGVVLRETAHVYESFRKGEIPSLPALPIQYVDYARWQRSWLSGEVLASQIAIWRDRLGENPPVLDLPTDRPRPAEQTYNGTTLHFDISQATTAAIEALSRAGGATPFMTLLSTFAILLSRYSRQEEFVIGSPVASRRDARTEDLIGFFVNTLPLRMDLSAGPSFRDLLRRVREVSLQAYAHQDVPFEKLVEELQPRRDTSRPPIFQVVFAMQNMPLPDLRIGDVAMAQLPEPGRIAKFDLMLTIQPAGNRLAASLNYNRDLFDEGTIQRMAGHFERLLQAVIADPDADVFTLPVLGVAEQEALARWNETASGYPRDKCIQTLFEEQAERCPDAVAVTGDNRTLTYRQLNELANARAHELMERGVRPETMVGLCVERSVEMIVALLAILKAGGAYVPLDPAFPKERLRFILVDTQARIVVVQEHLRDRLPDLDLQVLCLDGPSGSPKAGNPAARVTGDNLAYAMYTSGSTGTPKGIGAVHHGVVRLVRGTNYATFDSKQVFLQMAPLSFDASTLEIWGPLLNGGRLVILPPGPPTPEELGEAIRRHAVTTLWLTAGLFHQVVDHDVSVLDPVRQLLSGGDVLSPAHVRQVLERRRGGVLINGYGPTECTTFTCCCPLRSPQEVGPTVPIGHPIANTRVYILDRDLGQVPVGVPGELYVGGDALARGYINQPGLTAERFIPHPFAQTSGERLYRTGDLARYRSDGRIEFLGRTDGQVKIRGFRIEVGEVEVVLAGHPHVREAVVMALADVQGGKRLVAYVVPQPGTLPTASELRQFLQERMPDYMVPAAIVLVEGFPLTANGKVDRAALPAPQFDRPRLDAAYTAPASAALEQLVRIWAEVLRVDRVGIDDNFFELGGDSILSLRVVSLARRAGIHITTRQIFQHQTIAALAAVAEGSSAHATPKESATDDVPLLPAQRWFFEQDLVEPHHWNQSVLLAVPSRLDESVLRKALQAVVDCHGALRSRFVRDGALWRQTIVLPGTSVPLEHMDVSSLAAGGLRDVIASEAARIESSLDLQQGPLLRAAWFNAGDHQAGRLLLVIHHLAIDGVSWRILLEDLQAAYAGGLAGQSIDLPAPAVSLRQWGRRLVDHASCDALRSESEYWRSLPAGADLPLDLPGGLNTGESSRRVVAELTAEQTESLLREVPGAYHTQIDEVLLAALGQTLAGWLDADSVAVELEGHGREVLAGDADLSRTIGWLTSLYPVLLKMPPSAGPGEVLCAVKEQLRAVPNRGIGFGLLRYLADEATISAMKAIRPAGIRFNYLGQFDQVLGGGSAGPLAFEAADESIGPEHSPKALRTCPIEVNALVAAGRLRVDWIYSRNLHRPETIERLADRYITALRELICHCRSTRASDASPIDFPLAGLDAGQLAKIASLLGRKT